MKRLLLCVALLGTARAWGLDWSQPWTLANDAAAARDHSDEYAWRLFVALNWPADPEKRASDAARQLGADGAVVWQAWQNAEDVYRDDGSDPGRWTISRARSDIADEKEFESQALRDLPNLRHIVGGRMVPLIDPWRGAARLTEIRMNRIAFDYVRRRELYNVEGQLRAVSTGGGVHFPAGSIEVKAQWRPIDAGQQARYFTQKVRLADGEIRLYGLTALHIVSKDLPDWFWATFEHEENSARDDGWKLPSRDGFACRGGAPPDCNAAPAGIGLDGNRWSHYRLRGTETGFLDSAGRPQRLANSEFEAGFQETSSCMTCHARSAIAQTATIANTAQGAPRLPIFDSRAAETSLRRRGFVGLPRGDWYEVDGEGGRRTVFQPLDFVWSLSKAHPKGRTT